MRIFSTAARHGRHTVYVRPGANTPECPAEWLEDDGAPKTIAIHFIDGEADVPDPLGKWMKAHGQATGVRIPESSFLTMPPAVAMVPFAGDPRPMALPTH